MAGIDVARAMGAAFGPGPDQVLFGTIAGVGTTTLNTVDVYLGNSPAGVTPSAATSLPYASGYNPMVGDGVCILHGQGSSKSSYLVLCTVAGASSGGGSAGVPIGAIQMFPVTITYANWLLCNGGTFSAVTYPVLNTLLGGNTLPNLVNFLPMGAGSTVSLGATAGAATANGLVSHTHTEGSHTHGGPAHTHTSAAHAHSHSHSHNHTYTQPVSAGTNATAGSTLATLTVNPGQNTSTDATNDATSTTPGATGSASGTTGSGAGSGTGSAGSGSTFSVLNPVLGVAYFIRAA